MVEKRGKQVYIIDEEELEIFMLDYEKLKQKSEKHLLLRFKMKIYIYINY